MSKKNDQDAALGDLLNINKIEKKSTKVAKMSKVQSKPTKNKHGDNIKQHFGTWKYFINKLTQEKEKCYITLEGKRLGQTQGVVACEVEQRVDRRIVCDQIKQVGQVEGSNKQDLAYWGLPKGIQDAIYKQTGI